MKFPAILEAGLKNGILTEAKYVKGSYIVFSTADEMYGFTEKYGNSACKCTGDESVLVKGAKCYLLENKENIQNWKPQTEYRWSGSEWQEVPTAFPDVPNDGILYGRKDGAWYEIKFDEDAIKAINTTLTNQQTQIDNKQPLLVSGENIKTFYGNSILGEGDLTLPIANAEQVGGVKSGVSQQGEGFTSYEVEINQTTGIGSVNIPPLTGTATPEEIIKILTEGGLSIDGGNATE